MSTTQEVTEHKFLVDLLNIWSRWSFTLCHFLMVDPVVLKILNSRTWKNLKSSVVIFQALETSPASLTSVVSATSLASTASKAQFPKKNPYPNGLIITGTEITITGIFSGMDHQKSYFSLRHGIFSDGGC